MDTYTKRTSIFLTSSSPSSDKIVLGSHINGVPRLILTVIQVKIIMMICQGEKILGSGILVQFHQFIRVPLFSLPLMYPILKAEFRGVTHCIKLIIIMAIAFDIHLSGIPITVFRLALRSPMSPYTEFRISKPLRAIIIG